MSKRTAEVNGLTFGVGHVGNKSIDSQTINGLNVEANPAPIAAALMAFVAIMHLPDIIKAQTSGRQPGTHEDYYVVNDMKSASHLKVNGLNVSTGCFFTRTSMSGLNISLGNKFKYFNGVSLTALGTIADQQKGVSIGLANTNNNLGGASIGVYNQSHDLNGLHLGVLNNAKNSHGLQIGLVNICKGKGFQMGLWNVNGKRKMPFLNW